MKKSWTGGWWNIQSWYLPNKAKWQNYPHLIWIEAPYHDILWDDTEVRQLPRNHRKATWQTRFSFKSEEDMESIWYKSLHQRVSKTIAGYKSYWEAIDRTVKFCDITSLKRIAKKEMKYFEPFNRNNDKFHWSRQEDRKPNDKRIEESLHLLQNHEYLSHAAKIFTYSII